MTLLVLIYPSQLDVRELPTLLVVLDLHVDDGGMLMMEFFRLGVSHSYDVSMT